MQKIRTEAFQEFFHNFRDSVYVIISIYFSIFLVINFLEPWKMIFEQSLQNILAGYLH